MECRGGRAGVVWCVTRAMFRGVLLNPDRLLHVSWPLVARRFQYAGGRS